MIYTPIQRHSNIDLTDIRKDISQNKLSSSQSKASARHVSNLSNTYPPPIMFVHYHVSHLSPFPSIILLIHSYHHITPTPSLSTSPRTYLPADALIKAFLPHSRTYTHATLPDRRSIQILCKHLLIGDTYLQLYIHLSFFLSTYLSIILVLFRVLFPFCNLRRQAGE